jgi:hypothetical protein
MDQCKIRPASTQAYYQEAQYILENSAVEVFSGMKS